MGWLRKIFRRKRRRVEVEVGNDLYRIFEVVADRDGLSVNEWAKRLLTNAVPKKELRLLNQAALHAAGLGAVFDQLDRDGTLTSNLVPLAPSAVPRVVKAPAVPGHPCIHLRAEYAVNYSAKDCQGSCGHPGQEGRVCHWAPPVATQCPVFEPRFKLPVAASH